MRDQTSDEPLELKPDRWRPSRRGIDLWLRWLGILLPLAAIYAFVGVGRGPGWATAAASLFVWAAFMVALLVRRDWRGALAVSVINLIVDAPWLVIMLLGGFRD
ncbi:MAG TPA: hypothetical protein VIL51_03950 [Thermoleophilia bacterium]